MELGSDGAEIHRMSEQLEISYDINAADDIEAVSDSWSAFARENRGEHLLPPPVLGRSLWDSITDVTTRGIYAALLERVRRGLGPVHFQFRCDAPTMRRLLDMRMTLKEAGSVVFRTAPVTLEPRPAVAMPDARGSGPIQVSCAWCARLRVAEREWLEVEAAMRVLDPFGHGPMPRLSHGICPDCFAAMEREVAGEVPRDGPVTTLGALTPV